LPKYYNKVYAYINLYLDVKTSLHVTGNRAGPECQICSGRYRVCLLLHYLIVSFVLVLEYNAKTSSSESCRSSTPPTCRAKRTCTNKRIHRENWTDGLNCFWLMRNYFCWVRRILAGFNTDSPLKSHRSPDRRMLLTSNSSVYSEAPLAFELAKLQGASFHSLIIRATPLLGRIEGGCYRKKRRVTQRRTNNDVIKRTLFADKKDNRSR
jgi:hypothetical protein